MSMTPESEEDRLGRLSRRIEEWLKDSSSRAETLRALVSEVRYEQTLSSRHPEPAVTTESDVADSGSHFARFARDLEKTPDQTAILGSLVESAASAASRVLLFIVRGESVIGWAARGFPPDFAARTISFPLTGAGLVTRCHECCAAVIEPPLARTGNADLLLRLGGVSPRQMLAVPVWVRDRVAAVLYADTGESTGPWKPESVCVLATLAALNLEVLPARVKHPRPAAEPEVTVEESDTRFPSSITCDEPPAVCEPSLEAQEAEPAEPEQEPQHEEALRFARLLASEIVLYNATELDDGRRHKDIYQRLKDEIDRSHQMFQERFDAQESGTSECFRKELVRILAEGDESALTLPWS